MTPHTKTTHTAVAVTQILGDVKAAIKSLGPHGRLVVVIEKFDGGLLHRMERSRLTEDELRRLMETPPRRVKGVRR